MSQMATDQKVSVFTFTTSRIVTAAVLVALVILMGVVPFIGFIPVPTPAGSMTTEHLPVILGSILEGPLVGMVAGLAFGLISFLRSPIPLFKDPIVAIVPRILIGITPWLVYTMIMRAPFTGSVFSAFKRIQLDIAAGAAGFVGAATNTIFVLGFAIWRFHLPVIAFVVPILPQAIIEAIVSTILMIVITRAIYVTRNQILRAPDRKKREELPY
jgi:uncharacterized membrane protein